MKDPIQNLMEYVNCCSKYKRQYKKILRYKVGKMVHNVMDVILKILTNQSDNTAQNLPDDTIEDNTGNVEKDNVNDAKIFYR